MSWLKDWLKILAGAATIAFAAILAGRATREREAVADEGTEAELREQVLTGHGEARKRALSALERIKAADELERKANRNLDKGSRNAKAESVLDRWHRRANRVQ